MQIVDGDSDWTVYGNVFRYAIVKLDNASNPRADGGVWVKILIWYGLRRRDLIPLVKDVVDLVDPSSVPSEAPTSYDNPFALNVRLPHAW
jgi:hypothetical protein